MILASETAGEVGDGQETCGGVVIFYVEAGESFSHQHDAATRREIARRLAALKGYAFEGEYDPRSEQERPLYFVPSDTLPAEQARSLGIDGIDDLFGGVVPHPFVATKAISHPLVDPSADAPAGWSREFARGTEDAVIEGFTAFSREDAREAGRRLLERGPVRIKPVLATSGRGQVRIDGEAELDAGLGEMDLDELEKCGLVLEEDLKDVVTYSVGQVEVAEWRVSYVGTQRTTRSGRGEDVYGGSDLLVARGGFDDLLGLDLPQAVRLAVIQASRYDAAATECFPGLFASRRNYDVAQGLNPKGRRCSGVLEQSWRLGGATGAEIAALEALRARPELKEVRTETVEVYGDHDPPPPGATVYFDDEDDVEGPMLKYARVVA